MSLSPPSPSHSAQSTGVAQHGSQAHSLSALEQDVLSVLSKGVSVRFPPHLSARQKIRALLTLRPPLPPLPESTLTSIDSLLQQEAQNKQKVDSSKLDRISGDPTSAWSRVSLYRGDITTLSIGAIVNAANSALLGCFQPTHMCIDNVIHAAAGPRLRLECQQRIDERQLNGAGDEAEPGECILTRGYNLPAAYVLHTVGPQLEPHNQSEPTQEQREQLRACYLNCLETAEKKGDINSIAFCCISTGLFAFPPLAAAEIAIQTVFAWLTNHPQANIKQVVFNVFLETDLEIYKKLIADFIKTPALLTPPAAATTAAATVASTAVVTASSSAASTSSPSYDLHTPSILAKVTPSLRAAKSIVASTFIPPHVSPSLEGVDSKDLSTALSWLRSSSSLLICGGAGVSAAAGLDYTSRRICAAIFPTMTQYQFYNFYQAIGKHDWEPSLQWGYLLHKMWLSRFNWPKSQIYQELLRLSKLVQQQGGTEGGEADRTFVYTSNADGMFEQNGFPTDSLYTIQGDYSRLQCLTPCSPSSHWPIQPYLAETVSHIDTERTQKLPEGLIPSCPNCGGKMFLNVRGGRWFLETPQVDQRKRYYQFLQRALQRATPQHPLTILEIGAGFNTPGVIRIPNEHLSLQHPDNVRLIRINAEYPEVDEAAPGGAVGIPANAAQVIHYFARQLKVDIKDMKEIQ